MEQLPFYLQFTRQLVSVFAGLYPFDGLSLEFRGAGMQSGVRVSFKESAGPRLIIQREFST